jgi:formate dehydrogenase iron-sulfur subunit
MYAGVLFLHLPGSVVVGLLTVLFGVIGVTCSARIYVVPARPAWYSGYTIAEFFATAVLLGPLFVRALNVRVSDPAWLSWAAVLGGAAQLLIQVLKFLWLTRSEQFELRASALLLSGRLQRAFLIRLGVLIAAGIVLPLETSSTIGAAAALVLALGGEWLGRWLFFVSVVPKNIAAAFTAAGKAAA